MLVRYPFKVCPPGHKPYLELSAVLLQAGLGCQAERSTPEQVCRVPLCGHICGPEPVFVFSMLHCSQGYGIKRTGNRDEI